MMKKICTVILVAVACSIPFGAVSPVQASLIGNEATGEVQFGGSTAQGPATATVVNPGVEFDFNNADFDVYGNGVSFFNILPGTVGLDETYLVTFDWTVDKFLQITDWLQRGWNGVDTSPVFGIGSDYLSATLPAGTVISSGASIYLNVTVESIPEPSTLLLLGLGLLGVGGLARRRKD